MTWEIFIRKVQERFYTTRQICKIECEFLSLEKWNTTIVKYNTMFYRKLQFVESYFPTDAKHVDHYAEELSIEYRATIRYHNTLESSMDKDLRVEVDLATPGHSIAKVGEKSKWEGSCESSRKKNKGHQRKKTDKPNLCKKCYSIHNGPCSDSIMSYMRCGKLGHKQAECKNELICYKCRQTSHMSGHI